jgi:hypothetical protein
MRLAINSITLLVIGAIIGSIAAATLSWPFFDLAQASCVVKATVPLSSKLPARTMR